MYQRVTFILLLIFPVSVQAASSWTVIVPDGTRMIAKINMKSLVSAIRNNQVLANLTNIEQSIAESNQRASNLGIRIDEDVEDITFFQSSQESNQLMMASGRFSPTAMISAVKADPEIEMLMYRRLPFWRKKGETDYATLLGTQELLVGTLESVKLAIDRYYEGKNRVPSTFQPIVPQVADKKFWVIAELDENTMAQAQAGMAQMGFSISGLKIFWVTGVAQSENINIEAGLICDKPESAVSMQQLVKQVLSQYQVLFVAGDANAKALALILGRIRHEKQGSTLKLSLKTTLNEIIMLLQSVVSQGDTQS